MAHQFENMNRKIATGLAIVASGVAAQSAEALPPPSHPQPDRTEEAIAAITRTVGSSCGIRAAIGEIKEDVQTGQKFSFGRAEGQREDTDLKIFEEGKNGKINENEGYILNPLALKCGKDVVRYVGVAKQSTRAPGSSHSVNAFGSPLKVKVVSIAPKNAYIREEGDDYVSQAPAEDFKVKIARANNLRFTLRATNSRVDTRLAPNFTDGTRNYGQVF